MRKLSVPLPVGRLTAGLLLCFVSLLTGATIHAASSQAQTTEVSGRVLQRQEDGSVAPAQYVVGIMPGKDFGAMVTTESGADGTYRFESVPRDGTYSIVVLGRDDNGEPLLLTGITEVRLSERTNYTLTVEIEDIAAARKRAAAGASGKAAGGAPPRRGTNTGASAPARGSSGASAAVAATRRVQAEIDRLLNEGKAAEALPLAKQLLDSSIKTYGAAHAEVGRAYNQLGLVYDDLGERQAAEESMRQSVQILERALGPNHLDLAAPLYNLASLLATERGDLAQAEALYRRALDIRTRAQGAEHPDTTYPLKGLARLFDAKGDYRQAEALYQRALALAEKGYGAEHPQTAEVLHDFAGFYYKTGNYEKAEQMYLRVLRLDEKLYGPKHPTVAITLNNLGALYLEKSDYQKAEEFIQRGLDIRREALGENHPALAKSMMALGQLYALTGQSDDALSLYKRGLEIEERAYGKTSPALLDSLLQISTLHQELEEYAQAETLLRRAQAIIEQSYGGEHPYLPAVLSNLAGLHVSYKRDYAQAESLYRRALAMEEKFSGPEHPDVANVLSGLGQLYLTQAAYAKAEPLYLRALAIREKAYGARHRDVATTLNWLAEVYRSLGDKSKAIEFQARGNQIREQDFLVNLVGGSERQKFGFYFGFALETDLTVSLHAQFAPESEAASRLALTTILQRKGRALEGMSDSIRALRRRANVDDLKLLEDLAATRSMLATFTISGFGKDVARAEQGEMIGYLGWKADDLERQISQRAAPLTPAPQPLMLEQVQRLIPTDAALVEFYTYQPYQPAARPFLENFKPAHYVAYVLRPTGAPQWADLGETAAIDRQVSQLRSVLRDPENAQVKALARALDERLMQPVRKLLGPVRRLLVAPDSNLNLIPFDALVDEEQHYLIENYTISYLSSGRDLLRLQDSFPSKQGAVIFADPLYDQGRDRDAPAVANNQQDAAGFKINFTRLAINPLPGTHDEAVRLKELLPDARVVLGAEANEAALKQVMGPRILHLATHGFFFNETPPASTAGGRQLVMKEEAESQTGDVSPMLRSGLVLAGVKNRWSGGREDGVLTAMEVTGLNLWGTKLVVLSACETGLGEALQGEGVFGLRRALALAGAESQMMSLWKVNDAATRDLMVDYYSRLLKGAGRIEALRQSQMNMLRSDARQHPYYWAGFIHSGAWTALGSK